MRLDRHRCAGAAQRPAQARVGPLAYGNALAMTDDDLQDLAVELVLKHAEEDSPIDSLLTERIRDRLNEIENDTQLSKLIGYIATYAGLFLAHLAEANGVTAREFLRRMKSLDSDHYPRC